MLDALSAAEGFDAFETLLFCDVPAAGSSKDVIKRNEETISVLRQFCDKHRAHLTVRPHNFGLSKNIIESISAAFSEFEEVIVLEEDIVISPMALRYFSDALGAYKQNKQVWGIAGNSFLNASQSESLTSTYLLPITSSWGWATWRDRWTTFVRNKPKPIEFYRELTRMDFGGFPYSEMLKNNRDGKVESWAIEYYVHMFENSGYFVFPQYAVCENVGTGEGATHMKDQSPFVIKISQADFYPTDYFQSPDIRVINFVRKVFFANTAKMRTTKFHLLKRLLSKLRNELF